MKVFFIDADEFVQYAMKNIRLLDFTRLFNRVSKEEGEDEPLAIKVFMNVGKKNKSHLIDEVKELQERFNGKNNRSFTIVDTFNAEAQRNMAEIAMTSSMYQDFINHIDEPNQLVMATTSTKYLSIADFLQKQSGKPCRLYVPDDFPLMAQVQNVFELAGTVPLAKEKKSIEDIIVLKQIFNALSFASSRGFNLFFRRLLQDLREFSNVPRAYGSSMVFSLCKAGILSMKPVLSNGKTMDALFLADAEKANQFLSECGIDIVFRSKKKEETA